MPFDPSWSKILGYGGAGLAILAYLPYLWAIFRGDCQPSRTSWGIWALVDWVILFSYQGAGADATLGIPLVFAIGTTTIFVLSLHWGSGGWQRVDQICIILAGAGIGVWYVTMDPVPALLIELTVNWIGVIPTIWKLWVLRGGESVPAWLLGMLAHVVNTLAIDQPSFIVASHPVSFLILNIIVVALAIRHQRLTRPAVLVRN